MKNSSTVSAERKELYLKRVQAYNELLVDAANLDNIDIIELIESNMREFVSEDLMVEVLKSFISCNPKD